MNRKGKGYLTIGEISKITGCHPKSIRYYERIGILTPAEIDPENGYRYYSTRQVHHLFAIKTCIHFGLPLKDFPKYCQNGTMYTGRYLEDAAVLTQQKIQELQSKLNYIRQLQGHIQHSDRLMAEKQILEQAQQERRFLIREISPDLGSQDLFQIFTAMYSDAYREHLPAELLCGRIARFRRGQLKTLYAAVLLSRNAGPTAGALTLPEGIYQSLYTITPDILQAPGLFSEENLLVLETSCTPSQYRESSPGYILRCIRE